MVLLSRVSRAFATAKVFLRWSLGIMSPCLGLIGKDWYQVGLLESARYVYRSHSEG